MEEKKKKKKTNPYPRSPKDIKSDDTVGGEILKKIAGTMVMDEIEVGPEKVSPSIPVDLERPGSPVLRFDTPLETKEPIQTPQPGIVETEANKVKKDGSETIPYGQGGEMSATTNLMPSDPYKQMTISSSLGHAKLLQDQATSLETAGQESLKAHQEKATAMKKLSDRSLGVYNKQQETVDRYEIDRANLQKKLTQTHEDIINTRIDPRRVFKNMSTGSKILMGIGAFLAGFGSGQNQVLASIDKMVEQDIDAQKTDLNTKKEGANFLYKQFKIKYPDNPEAALKLYYNNYVSALVGSYDQKIKGADSKLRLEQLKQALEEKKAIVFKDLAKSLTNTHLKRQELQAKVDSARAKGGAKKALSSEETSRLTKGIAALRWLKKLKQLVVKDKSFRYTPGVTTEFDAVLKSYAQDYLFLKSGANVPPHEIEVVQNRLQRFLSSDSEVGNLIRGIELKNLESAFKLIGGSDYSRFDPRFKKELVTLLKEIRKGKKR